MSKLNRDILNQIFQDLNDLINTNPNNVKKYKKSLHSCLLVNKLWCEIMIPILWSYPYNYVYKKDSLFNIFISHLSDDSIKFLKDENIIEENFQKRKLSFNYVIFCKYLNYIDKIFPKRSKLLKKEIYKLFISECQTIKCLSSDMLHYPIYKYPEANISLLNLFELDCFTTNQNFYHELAQICRSIEKIYIRITKDELYGIAELIEMQKQIKYIYILEEYGECNRIIQALEKHENSIVYLNVNMNTSFLHFSFSKLINLQFLRILNNNILNNNMQELSRKFEKYIMEVGYYKLQILELICIPLHVAINIIQNTNGNLYKIKIRLSCCDQAKEYNQTIHKYCSNIKYTTIFLNRDGTLEELKNIFIKCQYLEAIDIDEYILYKYLDKFLDLLIELAPLTLYKIHIRNESQDFNIETLKLFFNNWNCKSKKTLHLYYHTIEWHEFIEKHKTKIVIEYDYYSDYFWNYEITWHDRVIEC
jgi:hypothetical protein